MRRTEAVVNPRLQGLVLSGGQSSRMGSDKGSLIYPPSRISQREKCVSILAPFCDEVYVSCREEQLESLEPGLLVILDAHPGEGPGVGILSAAQGDRESAWLVLACDFPFLSEQDVAQLATERDAGFDATCFVHADQVIEPLFSIWEPSALRALESSFAENQFSPRRALSRLRCKRIRPLHEIALRNVNRPSDFVREREIVLEGI